MPSGSWHIPSVIYGQPSHNVPLLFLQHLEERAVEQIVAKLNDCDTDDSPRELTLYPWIRDHDLQPHGICVFLERLHEKFGNDQLAIVIVESDQDDCIVVASQHHDSLQVSAARVHLQAVRRLASLVMNGERLEDNLADYEPIDLVQGYPPAERSIEVKTPVFNHEFKLSGKDQLTVISLLPLGKDVEKWKRKYTHANVNITIVDTDAEPPSRAELYRIYEVLEKQNTAKDRIGFIFFIDNILLNRIVAVSRTATWADATGPNSISLLPVEDLVAPWQASLSPTYHQGAVEGRVAENGDQVEYADVLSRERIYRPDLLDNVETGPDAAPTIWFLRSFDLNEERRIREIMARAADEAGVLGAEYAYMGHHADSVEELLGYFQTTDPYSPFYDPNQFMQMNGYPETIVAVDDRIFNDNLVILASSSDSYHPSHELGWRVGTLNVRKAYSAWINLGIGHMGVDELIHNGRDVWLGDLKTYSKDRDIIFVERAEYAARVVQHMQASTSLVV